MGGQRQPAVAAKREHVRSHECKYTSDGPLHSNIDRVVIGLSYAGIATYIYRNFSKLNLYELGGIAIGSVGMGYSLFDLGKSRGSAQGAASALRAMEDERHRRNNQDEDDWKGEFKGKGFEQLHPRDKILWLQNEAARIRELQSDEYQRCGQAYIKKEEAYVQYERRGAYGGADWKTYSEANNECTALYELCQKQKKRLVEIKREIAFWSDKL